MAHFYGSVQGHSGQVSRLGTKASGLSVLAGSWSGAIDVRIWHDTKKHIDRFEISQVRHHGQGVGELIVSGIIGKYIER